MIWSEKSVEFVHFTINLESLNFLINRNVPLPGFTSPSKDSSFLFSVTLTRSKLSGRSDSDIPDMLGWLEVYYTRELSGTHKLDFSRNVFLECSKFSDIFF